MVKRAYVDKNGIRKGEWSPDEDNKLKVHVQQHGHQNWRMLPKHAGLARCGKSCRLRWVNYLNPDVRKGGFTKDEVELITHLYQQLGPKWSRMAKRMPGRTDNDIKNHWHAHIKKHVMNTNLNKYSVVEDGVEKRSYQDSSAAAGSSTITSLDNAILGCDQDAANSWDYLMPTQNEDRVIITSKDGIVYLSDHSVDMGNQQICYPKPPYSSQDDLIFQDQVPKIEQSSSNSLNTLEWMSNGDRSVNSSSDSQEHESLLLQLESFLINEPSAATYNLSNDIDNYQWRDYFSSPFAAQEQLYDVNLSCSNNLWDL